jgi:predicted nucleotidyltransferase
VRNVTTREYRYLRGAARASSDIGLLVVAKSELKFNERMDLLYSSLAFEHEADVYWYTQAELERTLLSGILPG